MVAQLGTYQASNNAGELKPELHGRTDIKQFYAGLAFARNIEPVPQGGSRLSPRTRHIGKIDVPDISHVRIRPFTYSLTEAYVAVLTPGRVDFWRAGAIAGGVDIGLTAAQLPTVDVIQRLDTMLLFHPDVPSSRVVRVSDGLWGAFNVVWANTPQINLGATYTNQVTDQWEVYFRYPTSGAYAHGRALYLAISVNGEETQGVYTHATTVDWVVFAAAVKDAIEALPSVELGITVTETHTTGLTILTIRFTGAGNDGNENIVVAQVTNTGDAAATVTHSQIGRPGGEDLISETRGYAACASFYQDRLVSGGFAGKRSAMCASVTGEYFDLNTELQNAAGAILINIDTDGAEELHRLARARHLVMFTTDAEYFVSDRVLSRTAIPTIVNCSRNGSAPGVPVVESEGELIYVTRNRGLLYAMHYDDVTQAYVSEPLSLLASHIATDITGLAHQRAATATDANRLWTVRDNGTMTQAVMIRGQDVTAWVRWETSGSVRDVCVDGANDVYIAVERQVGGAAELHLEKLEHGLLFDGTVTQSFGSPTTAVGNLAMHEGAEVWAQADGYVVGPFTVAGAAIALPFAARDVSVGRWTPPLARTLPLPNEVDERVVLRRPKRVHTVRLDLIDTTSVAVGANARPAKDEPLYRAGDPVDAPPPAVSEMKAITGLVGFTEEGQVEITQVRPGKLAWRGITVEARQ